MNLTISQPIDQSWTIAQIVERTTPRSWEKVFTSSKLELRDISLILEEQERLYGTFYPLKKDIFNAFNYTPLHKVKVVIVGQDPYHQTIVINNCSLPRATGLAFSVRQEDEIPSSLCNIYKELCSSVDDFTLPNHGDLREWAIQGVLLLNTCLTVRPGVPKSHGDIWLGFISKVLKGINDVNPDCIFMLWGREAQRLKTMLGNTNVVLEAAHPSGLSAKNGFFGCNHFKLANEMLEKQGKKKIDWRITSISGKYTVEK